MKSYSDLNPSKADEKRNVMPTQSKSKQVEIENCAIFFHFITLNAVFVCFGFSFFVLLHNVRVPFVLLQSYLVVLPGVSLR